MEKSAVSVLVLFHDQDEQEKAAIVQHLVVLERQGKINLWEKGLVLAGENPGQMIQGALSKAEIILFLVSIESIASNKTWKEEVERSLARHELGELVFIPVIVRACQWFDTILGQFKPLPGGGKPISQWSRLDEPCKEVADAVKRHVEKISRQKASNSRLWDSVPLEFQEINTIFQNMPDEKVTKNIHFMDYNGKPASTVHFAIYAQMLKEIHLRISGREAYNFYVGNLKDAMEVEEIAQSITERAKLLKVDTLLLEQLCQQLEDASREFRLNLAPPDYANAKNWQVAKIKYVEPFCEVILKIEKQLDNLSRFSINIDLSNLSSN